jgi:type I restriction enzyme S subunit
MNNFLRYENYKDSGEDWLGEIPAHWEARSLKSILAERREKNDPIKTEEILSLSMAKGVTLYSDKGRGGNKAKEDLTAYKLAYPNDIVLNSMNVIVGSVGLSKYFGAVSPVYYTLYARNSETDINFYDCIFQNPSFQMSLYGLGNGILIKKSETSDKLNTIRMKIPMDKLNKVLLPFPPIKEQTAIAEFLARKTVQIEQAIAQKERLIKLLKERRQILIHKAVTRGLNPHFKLKHSGVDWIGEIPEHWEVIPLKHRFEVQLGKMLDSQRITGKKSAPYLRNIDVQWGKINTIDLPLMDFSNSDREKFSLKKDDLLVCEGGEIGRCAIWSEQLTECFYQKALHRIRPANAETNSVNFLFYLMFIASKRGLFNATSNVSTIEHLTAEKLKNHRFPFPPIKEQKQIVVYIENVSAKIETAISCKQKEIEKLKEYKTVLINSAVTGKINVYGHSQNAEVKSNYAKSNE